MRLEDVSVALRTREPWEAVDLGAAMLRAWWRPTYGALLATIAPIALLLHLLLVNSPWLALLITWWLKPLYDRIALYILAHAVFGDTPDIRRTLAAVPSLVRNSNLLPALTWRRLEIARGFNLAVYQLEGQRGVEARTRCQVLGRRAAGQAFGVLCACIMFELVAMISLGAFVDLVTPATVEAEYGVKAFFDYLWGRDAPTWGVYLNHAFYVLALCAIEPLYVAGSFGLYLNRRTALEAWDIELDFRRMALRDRSGGTPTSAAIVVVILAALVATVAAPNVDAAEREPREVIREVLSAPEFQEYRSQKTWQRRAQDAPTSAPSDFGAFARLLQFLSGVFADLMRVAAYALLAVGLFFLLRYVARNFARWRIVRPVVASRAPPDVLFGLDVRPEALPQNLAEVAAAAARTDPRLALSLLYRGALATLIHRDRIELASGDTEADCVRRVERSSDGALSRYFRRLVGAWTETAYAKRVPEPATIESLCSEWARYFSLGSASS